MVAKCPVCKRNVKGVSFVCVTCPKKDTWVHPRCGGYSQSTVQGTSADEQHQLQCNNCRKVKVGSHSSAQLF